MKKYDLTVVGGGISGVAASISAAREGLSVLLIEKTGTLGGAMSLSLVFPFMKYAINNGKSPVNDGLFTEMRERHKKYNDTSFETFKFVFDDMLTEAGVDILFHSTVFDCTKDKRNISSLQVATKAGIINVESDFFIDASGDGELIAMADCDFQLGREEDSLTQPMTTCFRMADVDVELFKKELPMLQALYKKNQTESKIKNPRENILVFLELNHGLVHFNTTRIVMHNPIDAFEISKAEISSRKQIHEIIEFLKENSVAFKNSTLVSIANHIGVRESRKLKGVYVLTAEDLTNFVEFEDTIALGCYGIDIHNPSGTGTTQHTLKAGEFYRIPYRSLLPKEYDNLLVAGRCLSATHEAHSAVRIMPICASLGEAAGTAIFIAKETGATTHSLNISLLQNKLKENGAAIF